VLGDQSTHGKGTVQTVYDMQRDGQIRTAASILKDQPTGSLKFTIGKFYRINGSSTQVKGVIPDLVFPAFSDYMEIGEARLPHVMPWDEISPARFERVANGWKKDINLPELREFMQNYMADSAAFKEYLEDLKFYAELREKKELPLEMEERAEFQKKEKEAAAMYRKFQAQRKNLRHSRTRRKLDKLESEQTSSDIPAQDIILDATLAVMEKLLLS
jgi:carboxyl-terminal processing protease